MERIGIRELRQNASVWLRRVEAGESFEVTDRGRPVARLVPIRTQSVLERLIAEGRARPAEGDLLDLILRPLPPRPDLPPPSVILEQMREHER
jgi:prevent-host-death family protein